MPMLVQGSEQREPGDAEALPRKLADLRTHWTGQMRTEEKGVVLLRVAEWLWVWEDDCWMAVEVRCFALN